MTTSATTPYATSSQAVSHERFGFGWGAVLAGLAIAIAFDLFFAEIGLAMNLGIIDRQSDGETIVLLNAIAWVVSGLVALFAGAWVAGRMANARTRTEGSLHGLAVWAAGAVAMLVLAFGAAGFVGGGMLSLVGKGLGGAAEVAQVAMPSWDGIQDEIKGALVARDSAARSGASEGRALPAGDDTRLMERSRMLELAGRHFALPPVAAVPGEQEELVGLMSAQLGLSAPVAEQTLAQWDKVWSGAVQRYDAAKAEALEAAEAARLIAMAAAGWAAVSMLLGAAAALAGGAYGMSCRIRSSGTQGYIHPELMSTPPLPYSQRGEPVPAHSIG